MPAPAAADSSGLPMPIAPSIPRSYEDLMRDELAYDRATPGNITTTADYDPETGCYIVHTRLGDIDIATPFMLTAEQYNNWQFRKSMQKYYRERNTGLLTDKDKDRYQEQQDRQSVAVAVGTPQDIF